MANSNHKAFLLLSMVFMVSVLLTISIAESRMQLFSSIGIKSQPDCTQVHGVKSGETCFEVIQLFNLTTPFFDSINPNLNCTALFVGQWLCVDGIAI